MWRNLRELPSGCTILYDLQRVFQTKTRKVKRLALSVGPLAGGGILAPRFIAPGKLLNLLTP